MFIHEGWGEWDFFSPLVCLRMGWFKNLEKKKKRFFLLFDSLVVIQQLFLDIGLCSASNQVLM